MTKKITEKSSDEDIAIAQRADMAMHYVRYRQLKINEHLNKLMHELSRSLEDSGVEVSDALAASSSAAALIKSSQSKVSAQIIDIVYQLIERSRKNNSVSKNSLHESEDGVYTENGD